MSGREKSRKLNRGEFENWRERRRREEEEEARARAVKKEVRGAPKEEIQQNAR